MPGLSELLDTIRKADNLLQRFAQSRKCKFCEDTIPQNAAFCEKCGKSQL